MPTINRVSMTSHCCLQGTPSIHNEPPFNRSNNHTDYDICPSLRVPKAIHTILTGLSSTTWTSCIYCSLAPSPFDQYVNWNLDWHSTDHSGCPIWDNVQSVAFERNGWLSIGATGVTLDVALCSGLHKIKQCTLPIVNRITVIIINSAQDWLRLK